MNWRHRLFFDSLAEAENAWNFIREHTSLINDATNIDNSIDEDSGTTEVTFDTETTLDDLTQRWILQRTGTYNYCFNSELF